MVKQCITDASNASSILVRVVYKNLKSIISYKHKERVCPTKGVSKPSMGGITGWLRFFIIEFVKDLFL